MEELRFEVVVGPDLPTIKEGCVCFETGATPDQVGPGVYEHHGEGFGPHTPGALTRLFEDLILGTQLPISFITHAVNGPDTVLAITLFLNRDLLLMPATPGLVYGIDLAHRFGPPLLAHVDPIVSGFFKAFPRFFTPNLTKREVGERIATLVQWAREYLVDGRLPNLGSTVPDVRVIDVGSNGFVLAETPDLNLDSWEVLYREGHLRGVLLGPEVDGRRRLIASRKNERSWETLPRVVPHLNQLESLAGGSPEWVHEGDFVYSPSVGTNVLISHLLNVFLGI